MVWVGKHGICSPDGLTYPANGRSRSNGQCHHLGVILQKRLIILLQLHELRPVRPSATSLKEHQHYRP